MDKKNASFLTGDNVDFIEAIYLDFLADPKQVDASWQQYFSCLESNPNHDVSNARQEVTKDNLLSFEKQLSVLQLITAYRLCGHRVANLDPLKQADSADSSELSLDTHGLSEADLDKVFKTGSLFAEDTLSLKEIIDILYKTYCRTIAVEYMHISALEQKRWLQERLEGTQATPDFSPKKKLVILQQLIAACKLEEYLHQKYTGQKRFSIEGGESLIPLLKELICKTADYQAQEVVIGMAHRGRLNVLINCIGKLPSELFDEFDEKPREISVVDFAGSGDVKYHLGYSSDVLTEYGGIHVTLAFNPSHLEIVAPVVEGSVRARQERRGDKERRQVVPIIMHGDSAFSGQGVVMETFNLSQTRGYGVGGTIHIVINNQIGFTTSDVKDVRTSLYCTDVAKMVQAPIFHVNADDPEAVVWVANLALDFRMKFKKDVVIDMVCYRRHGHSESDEPSSTQPIMYQHIREHLNILKLYSDRLHQEGVLSDEQIIEQLAKDYMDALDRNQRVAGELDENIDLRNRVDFLRFRSSQWRQEIDACLDVKSLQQLGERLTTLPEGFILHPAVNRIIQARRQMVAGAVPIDWGFAEALACASLLSEGIGIRLSGQDSGRGTFFHRHAVLHNQTDGNTYLPLQHITADQPTALVINSILSEEAVLGYEYGYATSEPDTLVIWEAQFGDFANGAQVIFDQFISSCESKWARYCGIVVFLPHGHDGQGPEHSSGRVERYLQLCAEENMQICIPSTAAQMFHMLRRQMLRPYRKPLIVMTPKSLLRQKISASSLSDLVEGRFELVLDDTEPLDKKTVTRLLICTGKIYYDLLKSRRQAKIRNIGICRIEQLYPFPDVEIKQLLAGYPSLTELIWVQEEPKNQGAWQFMHNEQTLEQCLPKHVSLSYVGRSYSASPAAGTMSAHLAEQKQIVTEALNIL